MRGEEPITPLERSWGELLNAHREGECLEAAELIDLARTTAALTPGSRLYAAQQHAVFCPTCRARLIEFRQVEDSLGRGHIPGPLSWLMSFDLGRRLALGGLATAIVTVVVLLVVLHPFAGRTPISPPLQTPVPNTNVQNTDPGSLLRHNFNISGITISVRFPRSSGIVSDNADGPILAWNEVPGAIGYFVEITRVSADGSPDLAPLSYPADAASLALGPHDLEPGAVYHVSVRAYGRNSSDTIGEGTTQFMNDSP